MRKKQALTAEGADYLTKHYLPVIRYVNWLVQQPGMTEKHAPGKLADMALEAQGLEVPPDKAMGYQLLAVVMNLIEQPTLLLEPGSPAPVQRGPLRVTTHMPTEEADQ